MIIRTSDYVRIHILPDNAKCKEAGKSPCDLDYCPFAKFDQFGMVCVPSECEYYTEETTQQMNNKMEPIVKIAEKLQFLHHVAVARSISNVVVNNS